MSFIGIPIGFYGYVFPGNINLMVVELYASKKYRFLALVLGLILIFETIYCLVSLHFLNTFKSNVTFYNYIEITSYILLAIMGGWMFLEKGNRHKTHQNTIYRGLFSIIFHPQQIPFWVVIGVIVNKFMPLNSTGWPLYQFAFFNAIGTLLAMLFYMILGTKLFNYLKLNLSQISKTIGLVYILLAIYKLYLLAGIDY